jgi:hypothetical protein
MSEDEQTLQAQANADAFEGMLAQTASLPGVRIDREKFLRSSLKHRCDSATLHEAIAEGPAVAGIDRSVILAAANDSINFETAKVTAISAAAGLPGGWAMLGTAPADAAQYFGHVIRIAQKLAYLYGWPSLIADDSELDDATKQLLILFIGIMFGVESAGKVVNQIATVAARAVAKRLPQQALTKGVVYPVVKKVAIYLGYQMTKETFGKGVSKAVPLLGAIISGGITYGTFRPMSARLRDHLASLPIADPEFYKAEMRSDADAVEDQIPADENSTQTSESEKS